MKIEIRKKKDTPKPKPLNTVRSGWYIDPTENTVYHVHDNIGYTTYEPSVSNYFRFQPNLEYISVIPFSGDITLHI